MVLLLDLCSVGSDRPSVVSFPGQLDRNSRGQHSIDSKSSSLVLLASLFGSCYRVYQAELFLLDMSSNNIKGEKPHKMWPSHI